MSKRLRMSFERRFAQMRVNSIADAPGPPGFAMRTPMRCDASLAGMRMRDSSMVLPEGLA
jgi:hypothetical protein